jgi:putative oxidoreductase
MNSENEDKCSIVGYYGKLARLADKGQSALLLLIRVYIGYQCAISGWGHLHHIPKMVEFFTSLHIPFPKLNVIISGTTELIGGILLLIGIASRLVSFVLVGNFIVALMSVQLSIFEFSLGKLASAIWNDQSPILNDTAFPFLATALIVLLFGPGWYSIDGLIRWKFCERCSSAKSKNNL